MEPYIAETARKHGVSDDDILHAYRQMFGIRVDDEGFSMAYGADRAANLIEIGYVHADDEDIDVIIHAMRTTPERIRWT